MDPANKSLSKHVNLPKKKKVRKRQ